MAQETVKEQKRAGRRPAVSIEEQIAETRRRLQELEDRKRLADKDKLERNRKAISDLVKAERLDGVDVEVWRAVVPELKTLIEAAASNVAKVATEGAE